MNVNKMEASNIKPIEVCIVDKLPEVGKPDEIYMLRIDNNGESTYQEYVYLRNECFNMGRYVRLDAEKVEKKNI